MNRLTFFFDFGHDDEVRNADWPREAARRETLVGEYGQVEDGMQIERDGACVTPERPWPERLQLA